MKLGGPVGGELWPLMMEQIDTDLPRLRPHSTTQYEQKRESNNLRTTDSTHPLVSISFYKIEKEQTQILKENLFIHFEHF